MEGDVPTAFALYVNTLELTRALKHLQKIESSNQLVHLKFESGTLTISIGKTCRDLPATGDWPGTVLVDQKWARAVASQPIDAAITDLRHLDGVLHTRNLRVGCSLAPPTDQSEALIDRERDIDAAYQILRPHNVSKQDVVALVNNADPVKAQLWSASDGRLVDEIASVWRGLIAKGVEIGRAHV